MWGGSDRGIGCGSWTRLCHRRCTTGDLRPPLDHCVVCSVGPRVTMGGTVTMTTKMPRTSLCFALCSGQRCTLAHYVCVTILDPHPNFPPFISRSRSLVPYLFLHAPLGPSPNHLTSHLMDHMTNPQSTITCHHSAVRSIMTCPHLTLFGLPAHDGLFLDCQLMMELYLEPPRHDFTLVIFPYFSVTSVTRYFSNVYKRSYF